VICVDTSVIIEAVTGRIEDARAVRRAIEQGERLAVSALVIYEWLRGPRSRAELDLQQALFPVESALPFGAREALLAAALYRQTAGARRRAPDLAIAATAITHDAMLWTLNVADFRDIPRLRLYQPPRT
jgi:predicted nucleic acid-binding protein